MSEDLLALFRKTGALLDGHFVLRSGLHSRQYFQCAILLSHTDIAERVCEMLADKLREFDCDSVISPALGGIIVGQEVGRSLGKRAHLRRKRRRQTRAPSRIQDRPGRKICRRRGRRHPRRPGSGNDRHRPRQWRNRLRRRRDCRSQRRQETGFRLPVRQFGRNECGEFCSRQIAARSRKNSRCETWKQMNGRTEISRRRDRPRKTARLHFGSFATRRSAGK